MRNSVVGELNQLLKKIIRLQILIQEKIVDILHVEKEEAEDIVMRAGLAINKVNQVMNKYEWG